MSQNVSRTIPCESGFCRKLFQEFSRKTLSSRDLYHQQDHLAENQFSSDSNAHRIRSPGRYFYDSSALQGRGYCRVINPIFRCRLVVQLVCRIAYQISGIPSDWIDLILMVNFSQGTSNLHDNNGRHVDRANRGPLEGFPSPTCIIYTANQTLAE